jgi:hypothetical protein
MRLKPQTIHIYHKYFYRDDSYGDPFCDWDVIYSKEKIPQEQIQCMNSAAHGVVDYTNKYNLIDTVEIPGEIKNINKFMMHYNDYKLISEKIIRDNFRKESSREKHYKALESIISEEYDKNLIDYVTGKKFRRY